MKTIITILLTLALIGCGSKTSGQGSALELSHEKLDLEIFDRSKGGRQCNNLLAFSMSRELIGAVNNDPLSALLSKSDRRKLGDAMGHMTTSKGMLRISGFYISSPQNVKERSEYEFMSEELFDFEKEHSVNSVINECLHKFATLKLYYKQGSYY